ncbi:hypothetical protein JHW43_004570 [Diplocarpon mali]|nr:hypothetical protein JHW43_004570 [Diplocarpon mali]
MEESSRQLKRGQRGCWAWSGEQAQHVLGRETRFLSSVLWTAARRERDEFRMTALSVMTAAYPTHVTSLFTRGRLIFQEVKLHGSRSQSDGEHADSEKLDDSVYDDQLQSGTEMDVEKCAGEGVPVRK